MAVDKNQAVIDFLLQCPQIQDNSIFFNFINAQDNNKQFIAVANDVTIDKPYIDGSVLKRYTFNLIDYKSINYNPIVTAQGYSNENIEEMLDTQGIIDWITEQAKLRNFPNFGEGIQVDSMRVLTNAPAINGVDTIIQPALVKYSISVAIDYLDMTM